MENTSSQKKKRAENLPDNQVGKQRHEIYKHAIVWVKIALAKGFNLEAITLVESLISDRLESRLSQLLGIDVSFKTLGELISTIRKEETDLKLKDLVTTDLDNWRKARNSAMHEMVKLADGDTKSWQDRMEALKPVASDGFMLFTKINGRISSIKNFVHKNGF